MKHISIIKKTTIIITVIFIISIIYSNCSQATIGNIFSGVNNFLNARGSGVKCNK